MLIMLKNVNADSNRSVEGLDIPVTDFWLRLKNYGTQVSTGYQESALARLA
jgi:hypothetical protein